MGPKVNCLCIKNVHIIFVNVQEQQALESYTLIPQISVSLPTSLKYQMRFLEHARLFILSVFSNSIKDSLSPEINGSYGPNPRHGKPQIFRVRMELHLESGDRMQKWLKGQWIRSLRPWPMEGN